ncbi:MAG TPA: sigma factor, partial [Iamia sp.]
MDALTRLALEARDGDEVSLAGFVRASQADVRRLAAHLVDPQSADDVTQEVYVRAIPALARYR